MSKLSGPIVFTATAEMAKSMKVFKAGATYVAHRAVAVAIASSGSSPAEATQKVTKKATKKATKKRATKKKKDATKDATKDVTKDVKLVTRKKAFLRSNAAPKMIVKFVRKNEGCNMTDIESHTKLPQATIRRALNSAREEGTLRTEGQRRGLRYFAVISEPAQGDATTN